MAVYLLHFDPPYKHAKHYCGYARDGHVADRLDMHKAGQGARLTQVAVEAGSDLQLVQIWRGEGRTFERKLKDGSLSDHCPLCRRAAIDRRVERKRQRRLERSAAV